MIRGTKAIKFDTTTYLAVLLFVISGLAWASPPAWTGKLVGVSDGDTITVMRDGRGVKVRLAEIDSPEKRQPYGQAPKRFTSDLCFGMVVTVKPPTTDRYGRVVAHVRIPDGRNLNEELVRAGLAWQYKRYSKSAKLAALEAEARKAKRGLWSEPNPVPPWEWRKAR
ncbi:thermonuclease family protein [Desulfoferula mesophila]|uniref:Endonuclease n=1 Tax=Desulfoferula mesophila TaxID=3058419 RepID=A0AAU9E7L6_9BACT|nr:endonuclease [Desulfoferula mesophilus]